MALVCILRTSRDALQRKLIRSRSMRSSQDDMNYMPHGRLMSTLSVSQELDVNKGYPHCQVAGEPGTAASQNHPLQSCEYSVRSFLAWLVLRSIFTKKVVSRYSPDPMSYCGFSIATIVLVLQLLIHILLFRNARICPVKSR